MRSARLRHTAIIQAREGGGDGYGQAMKTWRDVAKVRMGIEPIKSMGSNVERYRNQNLYAEATALLVMRYPRGFVLDTTMRVLFATPSAEQSRVMEIIGVVDPEMRNKQLFVYAKEVL